MASQDGINYQLYPCNYTPNNVVRDPSIVKIGSTWWVAHSNVNFAATTSFDIAKSTDGHNFTYVMSVDCSSMTGNDANSAVWAPEWFVDDDESVHVFMALRSTASSGNFFIYEVHPTNSEFTSWSAPAGLHSTPAAIDPYMVKRNGRYYLWWKDAGQFIQHSSSTSLLSGYTQDTSGDWAGFGTPREGPFLYELPNGTWMILLDNNGNGMYYSIGNANWDAGSWSAPALLPPIQGGKFVLQHGSVVKLTGSFP